MDSIIMLMPSWSTAKSKNIVMWGMLGNAPFVGQTENKCSHETAYHIQGMKGKKLVNSPMGIHNVKTAAQPRHQLNYILSILIGASLSCPCAIVI